MLAPDSAFVTGQTIRLTAPGDSQVPQASGAGSNITPLAGRVAVVTGAARGIGLAVAERLAREGAKVVGVDHPTAADALAEQMAGLPVGRGSEFDSSSWQSKQPEQVPASVRARALPLDLTDDAAAGQLARYLTDEFGGADVLVQNAGVTRDRTMRRMTEQEMRDVVSVNFEAVLRVEEALGTTAAAGSESVLRDGGRVVLMSSINGIAGAFGQTNYAATKAGLMGYAEAAAPLAARRGVTVNAIAPGFIETEMTGQMPFLARELGRRANAFQQGGLPWDVAAAAAFLSSPGAAAVSGTTLRVCGGNLVGR